MIRVAVIIGSTRPGRIGEAVALWVYDIAKKRSDAEFELIDLLDYNLPLLDESMPPAMAKYTQPHTLAWSAKITSFDAFVFVTAEYNHGIPAALKNALDFLYNEWNNKAAAFVGYGNTNGARAIEQLRLVMGELQIADVRTQVGFSIFTDFENYKTFKPAPYHEKNVMSMLNQLILWGEAMKSVRQKK